VHDVVGMNSRLDTLLAVVLNAKLARLPHWNDLRRAAAARYGSLLADLPGVGAPTSAVGNSDVWHLYVVRVSDRDRVLRELNEAGIGAGIHYPYPLHLTAAYAELGHGRGAFPVAERAATEILSLPLFPHISVEQQRYVVDTLRAAIGRTGP
jgi:dTDP-4-amino-4,6-dideoxygalactose transaminase